MKRREGGSKRIARGRERKKSGGGEWVEGREEIEQ